MCGIEYCTKWRDLNVLYPPASLSCDPILKAFGYCICSLKDSNNEKREYNQISRLGKSTPREVHSGSVTIVRFPGIVYAKHSDLPVTILKVDVQSLCAADKFWREINKNDKSLDNRLETN